MKFYILHGIVISFFSIFIAACGTTSSSTSSTISIPQVATLVKSSLPKGLRAGGTTTIASLREQLRESPFYSPSANETLASNYIINLFQNQFAGPNGNVQGYLMAKIATVDDRMSLFQGVKKTGCLSASPISVRVNLGDIDSMLDFTLKNIQCYAPFSSSSTDSGEVFGQNGTTTSIWVQATDNVVSQGTPGAFYANVLNAGSTSASAPETVDGVAITYNPNTSANTGGQLNITRFIATPTNNTFEMFYGSNGPNISPMPGTGTAESYLGTGFRMISNGQNIYADGTLCTGNNATTCTGNSNLASFSVCLDATTVLPVAASNCSTLSTAFTLNTSTASLTFKKITGVDPPVSFTSLPGPSDTNAALVLPFCKISTFSSIVQKY